MKASECLSQSTEALDLACVLVHEMEIELEGLRKLLEKATPHVFANAEAERGAPKNPVGDGILDSLICLYVAVRDNYPGRPPHSIESAYQKAGSVLLECKKLGFVEVEKSGRISILEQMDGLQGRKRLPTDDLGVEPAKAVVTVPSLDETIARMKSEILADVKAGLVPADCKSFSALHDYVDANKYGGFCDDNFLTKLWNFHGSYSDDGCPEEVHEFTNNAQMAIDEWLGQGMEKVGDGAQRALSLEAAKGLAAERAGIECEEVDAGVKRGYSGPVLGMTDLHVVQGLGRSVVAHLKTDLSRMVEVGESISVLYDAGKGLVSAKCQGKLGVER